VTVETEMADAWTRFGVLVGAAAMACAGAAWLGGLPIPVVAERMPAIPPPDTLSFTQQRLHNCGTVAMLLSWAKTHPQAAAGLVRQKGKGSYEVAFRGASKVTVSAGDLKAACAAKVAAEPSGNFWALAVLTAFTKHKCGGGPFDFRATDWLFPGEIGACLTGKESGHYSLKPETQDARGRLTVGAPVSMKELRSKLKSLQGKPTVAYTNRRIHIWAVMGHDLKGKSVYLRNPRRAASKWMSLADFRRQFQLVVWMET
jgi:hypothetical protein